MKFHELKRGQAFRFVADHMSPTVVHVSAGTDGMYGRFVVAGFDWGDPEHWLYCAPLDEVVPETQA